jgi:hypothetical protein
MLEKEFHYYLDHQDELVKRYNNRFIVIIKDQVVGDYGSLEQAYIESVKKHKLGTFIIQKCTEGDKDYTAKFTTPIFL